MPIKIVPKEDMLNQKELPAAKLAFAISLVEDPRWKTSI